MNFKFVNSALLIIVVIFFGSGRVPAQIPNNVSAKGVNLQYFDRTQLKAHFLAEAADPVPGGDIIAKQFQMFTFGKGGASDIDVILQAPECFFDYEEKRAWSSGRLKAFNAETNFVIEGEQFVFERTKTGATLDISNKVHTTLHRESKTKKTSPPINIYSDYFRLVSIEAEGHDQRVANYRKNVRVDDVEMLLTSETLRVAIPSSSNDVQTIIARENVIIRSKLTNSEARGNYAFYSKDSTNEIITLSGNPIWRDAQNEGRAEQFIFDRKNQMVFAYSNASIELPRSAMTSDGMLQTDTKKGVDTNQPVRVTAEFFEVALPTTNRPSRNLIAKTNVVISSPSDKMRATARDAVFNDATGVLTLKQNAVWQSDRTIAKADVLILNRTNKTFRAERNASLRLPANNTSTNQFLEISSQNYLLQTNVANFDGGVRADFLDGKAPSSLTCATLEILLRSNEVETIVAVGEVRLTQSITNGQSRNLICDKMTIQRSLQTGTISTLVAQGKVSLIEKEPKAEKKLTGEIVTMSFGKTNQLESMLAERSVKVEQGGDWATGDRAVYVAKPGFELFEITGHPGARTTHAAADGTVTAYRGHELEALRWNPKSGEITTVGGYFLPEGMKLDVPGKK